MSDEKHQMVHKRIKKKEPNNRYKLFGEFTGKDLKFLQRYPLKVQIQKLKGLLKITDEVDDTTLDVVIPRASARYEDCELKAEVYSSGIKEFDAFFSGNGIQAGSIIEFCGQSQSGKTIMIHTIISNVLKEHKDFEVIYFDSRETFQASAFVDMLIAQGIPREDARKMLGRIGIFQIRTMYDLLHYLQQLLDPQKSSKLYKKDFDMTKVRFIVINTITIPYFITQPPMIVTKKITSDLHSTIYQLSKFYGTTFLIGNLGLHKYKISESDKGDDQSSISSARSVKSATPIEAVAAALDEFWPQILDHRFFITAIDNKCDILGYFEIKRAITMIESKHERSEKSMIVRITDVGMI